MVICHLVFVQPIECATSKVNSKCAIRVSDVDHGEGCVWVGAGCVWANPVLPSQFCLKLKTAF